jgi:hypothetical protein
MTFSVKVGRADLARALGTLAKFIKRRQRAEAVLSFADGDLKIELPGPAVSVAADGQWDGEVRAFVVGLAHRLPSDDPMPIHVKQGQLYFASMSVAYNVQQL